VDRSGVDERPLPGPRPVFQHGRSGLSCRDRAHVRAALLVVAVLVGQKRSPAGQSRHRARPAPPPPRAREGAEMPDLSTVWFVLLLFLFGGYALLDGYLSSFPPPPRNSRRAAREADQQDRGKDERTRRSKRSEASPAPFPPAWRRRRPRPGAGSGPRAISLTNAVQPQRETSQART